MLTNKEIICPNNLLNVAHKKKGVKAAIVNAGKPLPMQSVMDAVKEDLINPVFIGNKDGNEKYISNLEKLSNTLGLSNYIKILGNFENMPLAYHVSDIILYPSIVPEPFGRVPIETQAAGKIIIASNNGGMTETIKEGEDNTGFRIKNNDMEDLKNKINLALNLNDDEISNLGKRAIEYVDKNFSLENMCKKTLDVYDRILNVSKK